MLWWLQGLNEDNKDGFCGHWAYGTNMILWLHGVDLKNNQGAVLATAVD